LCGHEWSEENCCGEEPCVCMAMAEEWQDISYKNIVLFVAHILGYIPNQIYSRCWERWYS
jgi:hypothetical protein